MLSPREITKRRLGGKSNLITTLIQQRNSSTNDNNNSNTIKESTHQISTQNTKKISKKANCCVAQSSDEEIVQADVKDDTEIEPKDKNRRSSKGDKSRFVEDAYKKGKRTSLKKTILDKIPVGSPKRKSSKRASTTVSLLEYYEDEIAGEKVIINKQLLYSTDDDRDVTIIIRDYITPEDYTNNVEYYRQINKARETFMRAAAVAGDYLQRGEVKGDRDGWVLHLNQLRKDKKSWHKMCEESMLLREKDVRYEVKKLGLWTRCWNRCVEEYKDIFPCCFPP